MMDQTEIFDGMPDPSVKAKHRVTGYAAAPGTGPEGETCGTCGNRIYVQYANRYYKCKEGYQSSGPATDIRLKSPACHFWKEQGNEKDDGFTRKHGVRVRYD